MLRGISSTFNFFNIISLLVLLASVLALAKPAGLNFGQYRGPTYSYNSGSKRRDKADGRAPRDQNKRFKQELTCYVTWQCQFERLVKNMNEAQLNFPYSYKKKIRLSSTGLREKINDLYL